MIIEEVHLELSIDSSKTQSILTLRTRTFPEEIVLNRSLSDVLVHRRGFIDLRLNLFDGFFIVEI